MNEQCKIFVSGGGEAFGFAADQDRLTVHSQFL